MLCVHSGAQCCIISSQWKFLPASLGAGLDPFFLCWKSGVALMLFEFKPVFLACAAAPKWRAVVSVRGVWQWSLEHSGQAMAMVLTVPCRSKQMGSQRGIAGPGSLDRSAQLSLPNARRKWAAPEEGQFFLCLAFKMGAAQGKTRLSYVQPPASTLPQPVALPVGNLATALLLNWVSISVTVQWLSRCQCHKGNFI